MAATTELRDRVPHRAATAGARRWRPLAVVAVVVTALPAASAGAAPPFGVRSLAEADITLVGAQPDVSAGFRVGPAGDLDGDGYDDVVVGAFRDSTSAPAAGATSIVYGPLTDGELDLGDADATLLGEAEGDFSGEAWAGVGDLDDDGYDDLVIGAPGGDPALGQPGAAAPGTAYVYYGGEERLDGTSSLADADAVLVGESPVDFAGLAVASAVDVDGDGVHDLVLTAPRDDTGGPEAGAVFVFYGGARLDGTVPLGAADATLVGAPQDLAGFRMDRAGDLVVGAPSNVAFGGDGVGATYVVYGSAQRWDGTLELTDVAARLVGEDDDDRPGFGLGGTGDLDADGYDDLVVGADLEDTGGENAGAAYLFYGGPRRLAGTISLGAADAKLVGEAAGDRAGLGAAIVPSLDANRFDALVVGAPFSAPDAAGAAYVFSQQRRRLRGTIGLGDADTVLLGSPGDFAGFSVGPAGDVDADGHDDLMVSADSRDGATGAVHIVTGAPRWCRACLDRPSPHRSTGGRP